MAYHTIQINQNEIFLTGLTPLAEKGKYSFFTMKNGGEIVIIFKDQPQLLQVVMANPNGVFLIKFFDENNSKYMYRTTVGEVSMCGKTIADLRLVYSSAEKIQHDVLNRTVIPKGCRRPMETFIDTLRRVRDEEDYLVYHSSFCRRDIRIPKGLNPPIAFVGAYCLSKNRNTPANTCVHIRVISKRLFWLKYKEDSEHVTIT